jgi:hypothetical protein
MHPNKFCQFKILFFTSTILLLIGCECAYARLGETSQELENRFGPPVATFSKEVIAQIGFEPAFPGYKFTKGEISVLAFLLNGKSCAEIYVKEDKSDLNNSEIETLLQANSDGSTWEEKTPSDQLRMMGVPKGWRLLEKDGKGYTTAFYATQKKCLTLNTSQWVKLHDEYKKTQEQAKEKLKDF